MKQFTVTGMTCDGCKASVERVVKRIPGVTGVSVSLADGKLVVEGSADDAAIASAVKKAGYEAHPT